MWNHTWSQISEAGWISGCGDVISGCGDVVPLFVEVNLCFMLKGKYTETNAAIVGWTYDAH